MIYAVFAKGIYRKECFGIFDDLELAKECANTARENDIDRYHRYEVIPFEPNVPTALVKHIKNRWGLTDNASYMARAIEREPVYTIEEVR